MSRKDRRDKRDKHSTGLPDFARRPTTRATRPPVRRQVDPEIPPNKRSKWGKMAGAMREIMANKQGKGANPKTTKLQKFATFGIRGFGYVPHTLAVGSYGDDLIASVKRCINARSNTPIDAGIRFSITYRLLKAAVRVDFGTINIGKEADASTALAGFSVLVECEHGEISAVGGSG